jgi:hypothetical protein
VQEASFQKNYVKLVFFLMDIGSTNAWINYKKCNEDICGKEGSRAAFFQAVAESMVNCSTKWSAYSLQSSMLSTDDNGNCGNEVSVATAYNATCIPAGLDIIPAKIGVNMRACQVCSYEMQ